MATASRTYDAAIIGAGPNGLAAAITLARQGHSVVVYEAASTIGGGSRSKELTLPGFIHDVCAAIHPFGVASPFFKTLPLAQYGVEWIESPTPLAHPLPDGRVATLERSLDTMGQSLGADGDAWRRLMEPHVQHIDAILDGVLGPLRPLHQMSRPAQSLWLARFGSYAPLSAQGLAERTFRGDPARGLFAGIAAHAMLPLDQAPTASAALLMITMGHAVGWPMARGGSQRIVDAMAAYLRDLGGEIITDTPIASLDEIAPAHAILADITPRQLLSIAGDRLPASYRGQLQRFRYGPGVFKLDLALDGPIPWANPECARAATVHVGGTSEDIAASERAVWAGDISDRPYVLLSQQSLFDDTRAPAGKHTVWAYCHVPSGSTQDMTDRIERQIERFAPGFRDRILARHSFTAQQMNTYNANYVGGDINGGVQDLLQLFTRPTITPNISNPYATPVGGLYLCSSSTPPGGGVHGMCGYHAANAALRYLRRRHISVHAQLPSASAPSSEGHAGDHLVSLAPVEESTP
ncbi:MAG TPA: NAD(P)/FAD-dependent oxidoreductase [Ktedonobacterales bacterium]